MDIKSRFSAKSRANKIDSAEKKSVGSVKTRRPAPPAKPKSTIGPLKNAAKYAAIQKAKEEAARKADERAIAAKRKKK